MSAIYVNSIKDKTNTRELASDSGSAWSWGSGVPKGSVIEQFMSPCNGSSITVQSGAYTVQNVTAKQELTTSFSELTGSTIDYTPPTGTQTIIYSFSFQSGWPDDHSISSLKLFLDNDAGTLTEVVYARHSIGGQYSEQRTNFVWAFHIGGSDDDNTGRRDTWTSARTIQLQVREQGSANERFAHATSYWDGGNNDEFSQPVIGITALA